MVDPDGDVHAMVDQSESHHSSIASETGDLTIDDDNYDMVDARKEAQAVRRFKLAVLAVLIAFIVTATTSIYWYLTRVEKETRRDSFEDDSSRILEAIGTSLDRSFGLLDSVAVLYVSFARSTNQTWPFVTLPDFAVRMAKILPLTNSICLNVLPIVTAKNRRKWEAYSVGLDFWVDEGMALQEHWSGYFGPKEYEGMEKYGVIHSDDGDLPYNVSRDMLPNWQNFPVIPNTAWTYNRDRATVSYGQAYTMAVSNHMATVSLPYMVPTPGDELEESEAELWSTYYSHFISSDEESKEPMSDISYPIVDDLSRIEQTQESDYNPADHSVVGLVVASMYWRDMIRGILPQGSGGIHIVFDNPCATAFTYQIDGPTVRYVGVGDQHDTTYNSLSKHAKLSELDRFLIHPSTYSGVPLDNHYCPFTIHLYPSDLQAFTDKSIRAVIITMVTALIFTSAVFYFYVLVVEKRHRKVLETALQSSAIVSSLFPSSVRDHLYSETKSKQSHRSSPLHIQTTNGFLNDKKGVPNSSEAMAATVIHGSPIAHLYPETTVLFADISGFTEWSSTRQPCHVFTLLETLYAAFDEIAKQRGVFKVETIGDCYVAVVGLPTPRKGHAVVMARFAYDCKVKMKQIVSLLAETLGPGTAGLALRIGLNSGPTTAGVLRGEKSRFQLFGDTVNTASRMESNGERNRIHVSSKTAELISLAGKEHWLTLRDGHVDCKGKGLLTTYWCKPQAGLPLASDVSDTRHEVRQEPVLLLEDLAQHLVDWNVDIFAALLNDVVATRDQVQTDDVSIGPVVKQELVNFITSIANLYKAHPFHNFEHSSHVVLSTLKVLDRIREQGLRVQTKVPDIGDTRGQWMAFSDPLTRFAITFSALIRDIDHPGASHHAKDRNKFALACRGTSSAEHSSIEKAWSLLMEPQFVNLSRSLFVTANELELFRNVAVNGVMAADLRDECSGFAHTEEAGSNDFDLAATIVLNYIVQAASVAHTMLHFSVYRKWNTRLLAELCEAYRCGRASTDPAKDWYEGELWFFDNYVIPLTGKLRESGIFGTTCDDLFHYAEDNRAEWEVNGRFILASAMNALEQ